ncbi:hypothetical protein DL237_18795 [Pseudooceanicola sediminis]|uniref:Right-handed parallel beta-helix repeat-containing protein n=1 Tax=Pseudooceanicola sediminis TaxID=2211117 RepID=A0A399IZW5_9RHOB|nr:right-handed parallel beta-helix repeat-containing protein [Pseudooceanicola sediminis]KAA2311703.1 hypothetical protein E0K93_19775 [Puniceibacterium sp. HSS470]RII37132.1 hypothetical protein DL237_18795 [Pseudooceanicola sediminis]|tara:strand:+ start:26757 stop:28781 length:2025 start_codon:yes stop_codon:yes gene_type:complete
MAPIIYSKSLNVPAEDLPQKIYWKQPPNQISSISELLATSYPGYGQGTRHYFGSFTYEEAAIDATDHHLTTVGGVKLYVLPLFGPASPEYNAFAFDVKADGVTDDTASLNLALNVSTRLYCPAGTYRLTSSIYSPGKSLTLRGAGIGQTVFELDHTGYGFYLGGTDDAYKTVQLIDFSIRRPGVESYSGAIGAKTLHLQYCAGATIEKIETEGNIGFAINVMDASDVVIQNCKVHSSKGDGIEHYSGTDGIHLTRVQRGKVIGCTIHNISDDPISTGSYNPGSDRQNVDILYIGNFCHTCTGGMKFYGNFRGGQMIGNRIKDCPSPGGYIVYEDRSGTEGYDQENILIQGNWAQNCGGAGGSGGISLYMPQGTAITTMRKIDILDNVIEDCTSGITCLSYDKAIKTVEALTIQGNMIRNCTKNGITLFGLEGTGNRVVNNTVRGAGEYGVLVDNMKTGSALTVQQNAFETVNKDGLYSFDNWIRPNSLRNRFIVKDNVFEGNGAADGTPTSALQMGASVMPTSIIEGNRYDFSKGFGLGLPFDSGFQSRSDARRGAVPTTGTWRRGQFIYNTSSVEGSSWGWRCVATGTFGSLSGVTADVTSGSREALFSDVTNIAEGMFLTLGADPDEPFCVQWVDPATGEVRFTKAVSLTQTGIAVGYHTPTFEEVAAALSA